MNMHASGGGYGQPEDFERELRRSLYRFDCPDAQTLGDYHLELLEPSERTRIAAHAVGCNECRDELQTLRAFLADEVAPAPSIGEKARRLVAAILAPAPGLAYGGMRGAVTMATLTFRAENVTKIFRSGESDLVA